MREGGSEDKSATRFVALVFLVTVPFYLIGPSIGSLSRATRAEVPASALMFICPTIAAVLLIARQEGMRGVRRWFTRAFERPAAHQAPWFGAAVLLMPLILVASYMVMRWIGMPLPDVHIPWTATPILAALYLASAAFEQLGWTAYATPPLQQRWNALGTGVIIGVVWAAWHVIPYRQAGNGFRWIVCQCLFTIGFRVILVWVYNNTGGNLIAPIVCHASCNVAWSLFPNSGSHYDPTVSALVTIAIAGVITVLWGPATLAENPFRRVRRQKTFA